MKLLIVSVMLVICGRKLMIRKIGAEIILCVELVNLDESKQNVPQYMNVTVSVEPESGHCHLTKDVAAIFTAG